MSLALVAGLVSFTSPCALPLLPGYVSYVSGVARSPAQEAAPRRVLAAAALFVLGFTVVFVLLGLSASALGLFLTQNRRTVNIVGGTMIILMGLVTTGLLKAPFLHRQARFDLTRIARGMAGAVPLGAAFAFSWTPCVGPVLASVLATAATTATLSKGALLLFAYSLGLGLPFLFLAMGVARGGGRLDWLRRNARRIEIGGGVVLLIMGIAVITGGWTQLMSRMLTWYASVGWPPI